MQRGACPFTPVASDGRPQQARRARSDSPPALRCVASHTGRSPPRPPRSATPRRPVAECAAAARSVPAAPAQRPALRGRTPRRRASGSAASGSVLSACELVATSGSCQCRRGRSPPGPRPVAGRSARPCRHAAPWATTAPRVPFERQHLREAERRGAAQDAADVAGVLHAVEHHAWHARPARAASPAASMHETDAARATAGAEAGEQLVRHPATLGAQPASSRRPGCCQADSLTHGLGRRTAARAQGAAQVLALEPHLARACGRRAGARASLRTRSSNGLSRELIAHRLGHAPHLRSQRAPARSCGGARASAVQRASAARCSARRVALVRGEAICRMLLVQRLRSSRSRCTLARIDAADIAATLASPLTTASAGMGSTGSRLPSTSTCARQQTQALDRAPHRQQRGLQDVQAVDLLDARHGDAAAQRLGADLVEQALAPCRRRAPWSRPGPDRLQFVEDHRRRHHRPRQRPAAGLVDARAPGRARRPSSCRRLRLFRPLSEESCAIASVARRAVSRRSRWCSSVKRAASASARGRRRRARPAQRRPAPGRVASPWMQLGHDEVAAQDVGQADPGLVAHALHDLPAQGCMR